MRRLLWVGAFVFIATSWSSPLHAAVVEVNPLATAVLDMDFTPTDASFLLGDGRLMPRVEPYLIQVDVSMRIYDLQPGQIGFSNTAFNVEVHGDGEAFSDLDLGITAWWPEVPTCDLNGFCTPSFPGGVYDLWDLNGDDGVERNDLQEIILAGETKNFGPPQNDRRRTLGQDADGDLAGSFYILLPGTVGATTFAETLTPWGASTYDENGLSSTANNAAIGGRTAAFTVVPEPSTLTLISLCVAALLAKRMRLARAFSIAVAALSTNAMSAAEVSVIPEASVILNPDFTSVDPAFIVGEGKLLPRDEPYLIQVDVSMRIDDLQPGQIGFSNTAFNVDVHGDGEAYSEVELGLMKWQAAQDLVDINGGCSPLGCFPTWDFNADAGPDNNDLQAILIYVWPKNFGPAWDPRRTLGQDADGELAGSFLILLPGTAGATAYAETLTPWGASTYDESGLSSTADNTAIGGRTIEFRVVPEPTSMALMAVAAALLAYGFGPRMRGLSALWTVLIFAFASTAEAAIVEVTPVASAILNSDDFTPVDPALIVGDGLLLPRDEPYLIQIDVSMRIYDLQPGQLGFSNTAFNVEFYGDGEAYSDVGLGVNAWQPAGCWFDPCPFPLPMWDFNADDGPDKNDLQAIILAGITKNFGLPGRDPRRTLGQDEDGEYAGNFWIKLPGSRGATAFAETLTPWGASAYDENGISSTAGNTAVGGRTATFTVVPEPSTLTLFSLCLAALLANRWRITRVFSITIATAALSSNAMSAAEVSVLPEVTAILNPDFRPVDPALIVGDGLLLPRDEPYLIQIDVSMRIYDLQPGQLGFANTAFNVDVAGDGIAYFDNELGITAWTPDNPWIDCSGVCIERTKWDLNADDGPDQNDLQAIILAGVTKNFGPPQFDIRRTLGQSEHGDHAGTFFIQLSANPGAWTYAETSTPWGASTYDENGISTTAGNTAIGGRTSSFTVVPEPSAIVLATLTVGFCLAAFRRATPIR